MRFYFWFEPVGAKSCLAGENMNFFLFLLNVLQCFVIGTQTTAGGTRWRCTQSLKFCGVSPSRPHLQFAAIERWCGRESGGGGGGAAILLIASLNVRWLSARKSGPVRNPPARRLSVHPSAAPHSKDGCLQGRGWNLQLIGPVQEEPIRALLRPAC